MADWFKFYVDGLDEPRFRYAMRSMVEVCPVWLVILSECGRTKSDTIEWSGDEVDLLGWSEKATVSPAKLNEAINLLAKIRYITITENHITVRKWNDLQSDYCRKFASKKPKIVRQSPTKSDKVPLEERRGEEIREDKNIAEPSATAAMTSGHQAFIKGWCDNYEEIHKVTYAVDGGRDGKAVRELLRMGVLRIDLLEIAKKAWLRRPQDYTTKQSLTIHGFRNNFNQIQTLVNGSAVLKPRPNNHNI